jgi:hypothetical protein
VFSLHVIDSPLDLYKISLISFRCFLYLKSLEQYLTIRAMCFVYLMKLSFTGLCNQLNLPIIGYQYSIICVNDLYGPYLQLCNHGNRSRKPGRLANVQGAPSFEDCCYCPR